MTSAIYADLVSRMRFKQEEERRYLLRGREALEALRKEIATLKRLIAEVRSGRLDEVTARDCHKSIDGRLASTEKQVSHLELRLLSMPLRSDRCRSSSSHTVSAAEKSGSAPHRR